ncbi:hypothetical protein A2W24_02385 [Microgenomates group bacterium RBG_16_45_19]|nr:MAG: hypothetical protein A2W24_02385 [Microgenomates group bacterium RBG_16_45_19]
MPKTLKPTRRIKVLAYGDSPLVPSGFGTVMKNLFYYLGKTERYDIDLFGINDRGGWKDPQAFPYHVYQSMPPGEQDPYGRSRFVDVLRGGGLDLQPPWDLIFFLNDPFVLENPIPYFNLGTLPAVRDIQKTHYLNLPPDMWFKTLGYFPIDSPVKPHWVLSAINLVDYPVTYTRYGQREILKADKQLDQPTRVKVVRIPHGNNPADFYPLKKDLVRQFRRDFFGGAVRDETFLVIVVGRNQRRKDIPRAMMVFKELQKRRPDSFLYVHAEEQEAWGSLIETALQFGLRQGKDWNFPNDFIATKGYPTNILNAIFNAADVNLSMSQGEGWGLPITEAMAVKTINLAPAHTSIPELFHLPDIKDPGSVLRLDPGSKLHHWRGLPIAAGTTTSEWICHGSPDLERVRPLANVDDALAKLLWVYDHPETVKTIENRAYRWISRLTWEKVAHRWDQLFQTAFTQLEQERAHPERLKKKWAKMKIPSRPHPSNLTQR